MIISFLNTCYEFVLKKENDIFMRDYVIHDCNMKHVFHLSINTELQNLPTLHMVSCESPFMIS